MASKDEVAAIPVHPGLIVVGCMAAGVALQMLFRVRFGFEGQAFTRPAATAVIAVGVMIWFGGYAAMFRTGTNIDPTRPTIRIVTSGVYRFTRNPIYLGLCIVWAGIGVGTDSPLVVASALLLGTLLHRLVVLNEEAYLERRFGETYLRYKRSVRRWI